MNNFTDEISRKYLNKVFLNISRFAEILLQVLKNKLKNDIENSSLIFEIESISQTDPINALNKILQNPEIMKFINSNSPLTITNHCLTPNDIKAFAKKPDVILQKGDTMTAIDSMQQTHNPKIQSTNDAPNLE